MVLSGRKEADPLAVGEADEARLGALEPLLHDDPRAGAAVHTVHEDRAERGLGLVEPAADHDALARREAVRLHDDAAAAGARPRERRLDLGERPVLGGRDPPPPA